MTTQTPYTFTTHTNTRLTHAQAHTFLSTFLDRADIDAAYRPDSTLTERGPQSVSTGATPNLTLHHLKRILRGIEGKRVGGDELRQQLQLQLQQPEAGEEAGINGHGVSVGFGDEAPAAASGKKHKHRADGALEAGKEAADIDEDQDEWLEKSTFDLQQTDGDDYGEADLAAGERHPGAELLQPAGDEEAEELVGVEIQETGEWVDPRAERKQKTGRTGKTATVASTPSRQGKVVDKEERKRLKKLRNQESKVKREEERKSKKRKSSG